MPTYGYECQTCNTRFEVFQRITEDSLKIHDGCGGPLKKLVFPVGIAFKGSGFYVNDYTNAPPKKKVDDAAGGEVKAETTEKTDGTETKPVVADSATKTEVAAAPSTPATTTEVKSVTPAAKAD